MFIKYNRPNNHVLTTHGEVSNGVLGLPETFILRPGWNEFPKHIWDMNKNDKEILGFIKSGVLEVSDDMVSHKEGKKTVKIDLGASDTEVHLNEIKDEERAIEIVKGTMNRELLQRWIDEETRAKVKKALRAQIKPLLADKQDDEE